MTDTAALRTALRGDVFIEGVATRQHLVYRAHHRPTGIVGEFVYPQGEKLPAFPVIVEGLLNKVIIKLFELERQREEEFLAPVA